MRYKLVSLVLLIAATFALPMVAAGATDDPAYVGANSDPAVDHFVPADGPAKHAVRNLKGLALTGGDQAVLLLAGVLVLVAGTGLLIVRRNAR